MTYESYYKERLDSELSTYTTRYLSPLEKYKNLPPRPTDLVALLKHVKTLTGTYNSLKTTFISPMSFDALDGVNQHFDDLNAKEEQKRQAMISEAEDKKNSMLAARDAAVASARAHNESLIDPLRKKHKELLEHKKELEDIFEHYDISPLDIAISDNLSEKEFMLLIDESIATCKKYKIKQDTRFDKLIEPMKSEDNLQFTISVLLIIIIACYFLLPILCIPAFVILYKSVHGMYKDIEKLRISSALMATVDYKRFIQADKFKETVIEVDTTKVDTELQDNLKTIKDYTADKEQALLGITSESANVAKLCNDATVKVKEAYATVVKAYEKEISEVNAIINKMTAEMKRFPTCQNNSVVMSHRYTLGTIDNTIDVTQMLPSQNIVFDSTDRDKALSLMKLYLANALLSVRVKQLTVEIYDPKNMCGEFVEFFEPETREYIKPNKMSLEDLLKTYREYSQQNILELDNKHIDEFNKDAEERELVPKAYKLLLIVSEFDKLESGDQQRLFDEYMQFSVASGVTVWLLDSKRREGSLFVDGSYTLDGSPINYTLDLGKQAVSTYVKALANYKDKGIDYITKFGDVFIPRAKWWTFDTITGIKMPFGLENGDPTRGLNVAPVIGDANVHALLGGATGAGKSAAINQLLISLITMYPPSELQIVYIDFKNVEAAKFTRGYDKETSTWMDEETEKNLRQEGTFYNRLSKIPHLRIISGTTDGEYALSVFEFLMNEMARRQEIINKFGVTKVEQMRVDILNAYNTEHGTPKGTWADMRKDWEWYKPNVFDKYGDLPRLLVIFDEFQVMYNPEFVDNRTIDQINGKITAITKLARAMGAHFWFTSQSMKGTMSKDTIANFSLRGALRCTAEVSEELLGNKAAGTIKAKFGFMYTNDSAGTDKDANKFWRVPFLSESHKDNDTRPLRDMHDYIEELNKMLDSHNEKHLLAEFYDEKILVPASEIDSWYRTYNDVFKDPSVFVMGERANYSTNKAPVTLSLQQDGGENVLMAAFDRNDMLNLTMTVVRNLKNSDDCTLIMNVQDKETHTLLDVENIVDSAFLPLSYPTQDVSEFINAINTMVMKRLDSAGPYKPVYILLVQWERAPGIGVDINYKLGDQFKELLRKAPTVGVHFIFACREKLDMQRYIPASCNHRFVGLMPKDSGFFCENSTKAEKLPDANKDAGLFALYEFGTQLTKLRIYQNKFTKEIKSREIVI